MELNLPTPGLQPDRISTIDPNRLEKLQAFDRLLTVMDELRYNCPWDKEQTWDSLRHLTIEETYELADAIINNDPQEVKKEIGDLLLHLVFYAKIAEEQLQFDIKGIIDSLIEKLIRRHPHIYGETIAEDSLAVKQNWEQIKLKEGNRSVLSGVPKSLPSLVKAIRIQEKARGAGFDWDNKDQVWEKVIEELEEFKAETSAEVVNEAKVRDEFGDVLFSMINYARFLNINPEEALERTNKKFISRFTFLEEAVKSEGKELKSMSLPEMDAYWDLAKQKEKN